MTSELYFRIIGMDYGDPERGEMMKKVWDVTPFVVNVRTGSPDDDQYRKIVSWCREHLGPDAWPIHGRDGNWQTGGATVFGETFMGFATAEYLERFSKVFGHLIIKDASDENAT